MDISICMYVLFSIAVVLFYCASVRLFEADSKLLDRKRRSHRCLQLSCRLYCGGSFVGFDVWSDNPPTAETVLWTARPLSAGDDRTE